MALCATREVDSSFKQPQSSVKECTVSTQLKIHTGFLYNNETGWKLQQKLCLLLSGTKSSALYSGWEDFGIALGLDRLVINTIKYGFKHQDPTSYTLLAFTQKEDATIENIIEALTKIKRHDIVHQIKPLLLDLKNSISATSTSVTFKSILTPPSKPDCPFVFKSLAIEKISDSETLQVEKLQQSLPAVKVPSASYTKKILLTYSSDADDVVEEIVQRLRKPVNNFKLGVLVLREHSHKISCNPEQSILDYFAQVDYVFPVVTPQYIKDVTIKSATALNALENYDHKYVKYVYRLMNTKYIKLGCINENVRCLIPDEAIHKVLQHPIMDNSLFQLWISISQIDDLISAIIAQEI